MCGSVFASPNASQVRREIDLIDNDKGCVCLHVMFTSNITAAGHSSSSSTLCNDLPRHSDTDSRATRNYTGDVLNFGLAKEHYSAIHPDKAESVKFIVVGDDVAVGRTQGSIVGRR